MSFLDDVGDAVSDFVDPLDLFGGKAAERSQQIASEASARSLEESRRQFDIGQSRLEPFTQESVPAFQLQSQLSGARGPEEQAQSFQSFRDSPATQFLREEGLRLSSPGASGETLAELQRFNQGLALQDFDNQFNRLGVVSGSGQAAASNLAGAGEVAAGQTIEQQQAAFRAHEQGLAARQASRDSIANTGVGLATFFGGGGGGGGAPPGGGANLTRGVPLQQQNFRDLS